MGWRPEDIPSSVPEESPSHQSAPRPPPEATPPQATSSKWGKKPGRSKSIKQHQQAARSPPLSCDAAASALDSGGGGPPSPQERKNRIRDKLRHFFVRRPTLESLQEKGIFKDEPVFGCNLAHLCERDRSSVPRFVRECILEIERRGGKLKLSRLSMLCCFLSVFCNWRNRPTSALLSRIFDVIKRKLWQQNVYT